MKKILVGVFAHPDDEAFCVAGTLLKEVDNGAELHLICVTCGEQGQNPDGHEHLAEVRRREWLAVGKALGAAGMHTLDYPDGQLCNQLYHHIADKIETIARSACKPYSDVALKFITLEPGGVTGHLDHIAASFITTFVFRTLKKSPPKGVKVEELAYFCLSETQRPPELDNYYIFAPMGRPMEYITRSVDVSAYRQQKYGIIALHHSQRQDAKNLRGYGDAYHDVEHFCVIT